MSRLTTSCMILSSNIYRRLALEMWKQSQGCNATYCNLISAFESAGYQACADFVRRLASNIKIPADGSCHQSLPASPLVPVSPEMCVESLFLSNMPDDSREGKINFMEYCLNRALLHAFIYTGIVYITEQSASELIKIDKKLDIPLSHEPDVNTASVMMKHSLKVRIRAKML